MTHKENITAILECHFAGFKKEIIDSAVNRILELDKPYINGDYWKGYKNAMRTVNWINGKMISEIMDTGAYEQEVNGKTEFLEGINYCLNIFDKYKVR